MLKSNTLIKLAKVTIGLLVLVVSISGAERFVRLLFQPLLVMWALLSTGAWGSWRSKPKPDEIEAISF